ncbi:MAG: YDG domain-containing protein, partial [Comamonadaceae bacterium]
MGLAATKTFDGNTSLTGAVAITTGVNGEALTYTNATTNDSHVATASKYINAITLANGTGGVATDYALPTLDSTNAPVTINTKTVGLSASKTYDGNTSLTGAVTITTGVSGQALTYSGATSNDKNVATANKYIDSITLADGIGGLATDYAVPTLNNANAPVTITKKTVTLSANKTYDGTTALSGFVTVGTGVGSETLTYTSATANDAHVVTSGKYISAITLADASDSSGGLAANYQLPTLNVANAPVTINAATLAPTLTNSTADRTRVYNGLDTWTVTPTYSFAGLVSGDTNAALSKTSALFDSTGVAANTVTVSGLSISSITGSRSSATTDYTLGTTSLSAAGVINPLPVTLTGTKTYDGYATTAGTTFTVTNKVGSDSIGFTGTANLASKNAASQNITGMDTLATTNANYTTVGGSGAVTIGRASLTLAPVTATKVYDGTTNSSAVVTVTGKATPDAVTVAEEYVSKDVLGANASTLRVKAGYTILDGSSADMSGNYNITASATVAGSITAKALTETGMSVPASKVYNGTTVAVVSGTPVLQSTEAAGAGTTTDGIPYAGDTVSITGTPVGTYNSKDVGTATAVTYSGLTLTGAQAGNYTLTIQSPANATITPKALTMSGLSVPASKVYNGTTVAVVTDAKTLATAEATSAGNTSDGIPYTGDAVSISGTPVGTYNSKDVSTAATVTYSGLSLSGNQAGNYSLTIQSPSSATITRKALTISGITASSKEYDGNAVATVSVAGVTPTVLQNGGLVAGDAFNVLATGNFDNKNIGASKTVTLASSYSGADVGNYTITDQA